MIEAGLADGLTLTTRNGKMLSTGRTTFGIDATTTAQDGRRADPAAPAL